MKHYTKSVYKQILNTDTGEFEKCRFVEDTKYKLSKKQGWKAMYTTEYDKVLMALKSNLEKNMFMDIRDRFTKSKTVLEINQSSLAKKHKTTKSTVSKFMKKMRDIEFIKKTEDGYRMNPYMLIPYQADGLQLQQEWDSLSHSSS